MSPYKHQDNILKLINEYDRLVINYSERQCGISTILMCFAIEQMISGKKIIYVAKTSNIERVYHEKFTRHINQLDIECQLKKNEFRTTNNGAIILKTFHGLENGLLGMGINMVIFDDCYDDEEIINKILYKLYYNLNSGHKLIFTFSGDNHIDLPNFRIHHVNSDKTPSIISFLNKQKNMSAARKKGFMGFIDVTGAALDYFETIDSMKNKKKQPIGKSGVTGMSGTSGVSGSSGIQINETKNIIYTPPIEEKKEKKKIIFNIEKIQ